jgi:transposase InsO family protein
MDQKIAFVRRAVAVERGGFVALCQEFRISRKTGYKWLGRYRKERSFTALEERSRRPHHSPDRVKGAVEQRILELRQPDGWGARKIAHLLWEEGIAVSVATVHRTLLRHGLVYRFDRHSPAPGRFERPEPNDLFQADFKGPMGRSGARDEPLTVLDDHSRFALGVFALRDHRTERVRDCFVRVFERYGQPRQLLLDHGTPWWNNANGWGLSRLSVFFIEHGIELIFGRVRHPQTQGKIERFHRTLLRSLSRQGLPERWEDLQSRYDGFVERYNHVRPHESLGMQRPAQRYRPSSRRYSAEIKRWIYPGGVEVRTVDAAGCVRVEGHRYFVCEALVHQEVGLERLGNLVLLRFRDMYIREIDLVRRVTLSFVHPVSQLADEVSPIS